MNASPNKEEKSFRPSDYMRARRPECFSDSKVISEPRLTRDVLEYNLETLTSRKQEGLFEHFCWRLAQKMLCPNLLPQTGPTGGGDSKVDSETYPVANDIAIRWFEGTNATAAANQSWAFAFSTKKDWRQKVKADVKSIIESKRGHSLIYFITSQFVPDKKRSTVQDALQRQYGVPVRILDRTWIVNAVFERGYFDLVVDILGVAAYSAACKRIVGAHDARRRPDCGGKRNGVSYGEINPNPKPS